MTADQLSSEEYAPYYDSFIRKFGNAELLETLEASGDDQAGFFATIPVELLHYQYAAGKWTIPEIIVHLIDAERIFAYRALRFARNDSTPLEGFEENDYVPQSRANMRSMEEIIAEFRAVRAATICLFASFSDAELLRTGTANGFTMSVRALGFAIAGHAVHHCEVIKERYL